MRLFRSGVVLFVIVLAIACANQSATGPSSLADDAAANIAASPGGGGSSNTAALRLSATMLFGNPNAGSPFPPAEEHDQSAHAADNLVPRTVVIDPGGTVTFQASGIHQVAIYEPGKEPGDVDTSPATLIAMPPPPACPPLPPFRINDPDGRIAINGNNPVGCGPRDITHTFDTPGKYLVICEVLPHFNVQMYGWVVVRDR